MIPAPLQNADCLFLSKENPAKVGYAALAVVEADKLVALAKDFLAAGYHLEDVDGLISSDGAVSVYHFDHFDTPGRATVMVIAPANKPSFPSIASVYQGAEWHERETRDFFGFQYEGNPNFIPLLLAETMPDVHPLLKADADRAPLLALFSAEGREREVVKKAEGFTLLDAPVKEEPPVEEAPAAKAEEAPKTEAKPAEAPKAAPAPEVKAEPAPEAKPEPEAKAVKKDKAPQAKSGKKGAGDA
ncbi:NADH-quinone oxidoreductase subunit C [Desulfovibrio sp. OttesenSCG-928-O18]|nr:NADH-quinone oxidoreductase subunit C [Desulfovibrio sp. OttesenSCG-928-O18]